jgi:hypothetical protein
MKIRNKNKGRIERTNDNSKIKRVILFRNSFSSVSGVERIMLEEARYLRDKGIETHILTYELQREAKLTFELLRQIGMVNIEQIPYRTLKSRVVSCIS